MQPASRADEMSVFVRTIEQGSFSAAARVLGLTPSGVSKLVARLEDRLGARLLARTTRSLRLTDEGRIYFERCRELLAEIESLETEIGHATATPRGELRISLSHSFGRTRVVPFLPDFTRAFPDVSLRLDFSDRRMDLVGDGIDVAVRLGPIGEEGLVARRVAEHRRVVCAAPAYLARRGVPRLPEDLASHDCLLFEEFERLNRWPFRGAAGQPIMLPVQGPVRSNNGEALYSMLLAGMGIARAADFLVADDIRSGRLVPLLRDFAIDERTDIHIVYPHRKHLTAKVRAFVDFLAPRLAGSPWMM
jgi:DNA-binding transcriptional LysR family regulator